MRPKGITVPTEAECRLQQIRIVYYNRASQLEDGYYVFRTLKMLHIVTFLDEKANTVTM